MKPQPAPLILALRLLPRCRLAGGGILDQREPRDHADSIGHKTEVGQLSGECIEGAGITRAVSALKVFPQAMDAGGEPLA